MAAPKGTLWKRDDHTEGKHLVLEEYLKAWFPILGMGNANGRILFVDGLAGPGEYEGGEKGSPVVAMRVLAEHGAKQRINAEVVFLFIEQKADRARHLEGLAAEWRPKLPQRTDIQVLNGSFGSVMTGWIEELDEQKNRMAPALVMMDPFGIKDIPLSVVQGILANPKCEVYVTFMWEEMNRFLTTPEFKPHLDKLFGASEWCQAVSMPSRDRRRHLYDLYQRQLKSAGARHVILFHLFKGNSLKYSVFFATGHLLGSDRMKRAVWEVDPSGGFTFRVGDPNQMVMLQVAGPDLSRLRDQLYDRFGDAGWVEIESVLEFVQSDETIFHEGQLKKQLRAMERDGRIEVDPKTRKQRLTHPDGCRIRFRLPDPTLF